MPASPLNVVLEQPLAVGASINLAYPEGKTEGNFFSAIHHTLAINANFYRSPRDFLVETQPDRIVFTWLGNYTVPAGTLLNLQLEEPCGDYYRDLKNGTHVLHMVHSQMFLVNLGNPAAAAAEYYVKSTAVPEPRALTLVQSVTPVARSVVIHFNAENAHCTFTVAGEDLYGRPLVEHIQGPAAPGSVEGRKAFAKVTRIAPNHQCKGEISVGTGNRLGLPTFLPGRAFVLREVVDGDPVMGGEITPGETTLPPTAETGDRRGTYAPPQSSLPDGRRRIQLLLSLPNPGHIGAMDYAG